MIILSRTGILQCESIWQFNKAKINKFELHKSNLRISIIYEMVHIMKMTKDPKLQLQLKLSYGVFSVRVK